MDEQGFVASPQIDAHKFAIMVTIERLQSYWRRARGPDRLRRQSLMKVEPWIDAHN
jgi:hypothetical protein